MGMKRCKTNSLSDLLKKFNNLQPHRDITIFVQFSSKANISAFFVKYEAVYERLRFYKVTAIIGLMFNTFGKMILFYHTSIPPHA